jgi:hypothetical protein
MFSMIEIILVVVILLFVPWLIAVTDLLKSEFKGNDRLTLFLLLGIPIVGPILYFVHGKKMKTDPKA